MGILRCTMTMGNLSKQSEKAAEFRCHNFLALSVENEGKRPVRNCEDHLLEIPTSGIVPPAYHSP